MKNRDTENKQVSWAMIISSGLVGPKANPSLGKLCVYKTQSWRSQSFPGEGVVDGQLVNIPAPLIILDGVTKHGRPCVLWLCAFGVCRNCFCGKSMKAHLLFVGKFRGLQERCALTRQIYLAGTKFPGKTSNLQ